MEKNLGVNTIHEFDNGIPHLEGGIPILDQSLKSPFSTLSPPHKEISSTSP